MADDVTLPGTGAVVAADEISGKKHQRVKVQFGDDGSATDASTANPFPVTVVGGGAGDASAAKQDTIIGHVDGIEALLTTISGQLTTLDSRVDGLETLVGSTNTLLTTQNGYLDGLEGSVDGLETAIASTNTKLDTANTSLDNIETATTDTTTPVKVESGVYYVDVTLTTDTAAYASGDLIADAQIVAACVRANDATGVLQSVMVLDEDDQGAAFTIYFANSNASFGTENSTPSITDANARTILGFVDIATGDYKDLGGAKVAFKGGIGMAIKPVASSDDIYVAVVNGSGTPTYTASGLKLRLGFLA